MSQITVIMPTKNRAKFLKTTIGSIIKQTFKDWELIVIDDHSTDNTAEIIKKLNKDSRIKYIKLTKGTGPGAARDFGIRQATSSFIVLADSDDISYPDRLKITWKYVEQGFDVVYGNVDVYNIDTKKSFLRPGAPFDFQLLKSINYIPNSTSGFRKQIYLDVKGYDHKLTTTEDYDLWLTFAEKNYKFGYIAKSLVKMQIHAENQTKTIEYNSRRNNLAIVRKKHNLPVPTYNETKKLIKNKYLLKVFSTAHQKEYWFAR